MENRVGGVGVALPILLDHGEGVLAILAKANLVRLDEAFLAVAPLFKRQIGAVEELSGGEAVDADARGIDRFERGGGGGGFLDCHRGIEIRFDVERVRGALFSQGGERCGDVRGIEFELDAFGFGAAFQRELDAALFALRDFDGGDEASVGDRLREGIVEKDERLRTIVKREDGVGRILGGEREALRVARAAGEDGRGLRFVARILDKRPEAGLDFNRCADGPEAACAIVERPPHGESGLAERLGDVCDRRDGEEERFVVVVGIRPGEEELDWRGDAGVGGDDFERHRMRRLVDFDRGGNRASRVEKLKS